MTSRSGSTGLPSGTPGLRKHQQSPIKEGAPFSLSATKGQTGKFMSHLLGLDHEPSNAKGQAGTAQARTIKFSDLFHGIKLTPNFMFFLLFLGFFLWLFVIYWVRHHEPLADQVLGTPKVDPRSAQTDRRLVEGMKAAVPVRTSASSGEVFVPNSPPLTDNTPLMQSSAPQASYGSPMLSTPQAGAMSPGTYANQANGNLNAMPINGMQQQFQASPGMQQQQAGSMQAIPQQVSAMRTANGANASAMGAPIQANQNNYLIQSASGPRLKTIVSR
jgi:hypothetical protein